MAGSQEAIPSREELETRIRQLDEILQLLQAVKAKYQDMLEKLKYLEGLLAREFRPERPLSMEDPAIRWLRNVITKVKVKHPKLLDEWRVENGRLLALSLRCPPGEGEHDIKELERIIRWAFDKALNRPQGG